MSPGTAARFALTLALVTTTSLAAAAAPRKKKGPARAVPTSSASTAEPTPVPPPASAVAPAPALEAPSPVASATLTSASSPSSAPLAPPVAPDSAPQEGDRKRGALLVAATPVLPVGRFSDAVSVGLGGVLGLDYAVHPNVALLARVGYIHHLPKASGDISLGAVPIWAGARYAFLGADGPYVEAAAGPTILIASVSTVAGRVSDNDTKISVSGGGGYRFRAFDVGARVLAYDLGHAGDTAALMATVGWSFVAF